MPDTTDHDRLMRIEEKVNAIVEKLDGLPCGVHSEKLNGLAKIAVTNMTKIGTLTWIFGVTVTAFMIALGWFIHHAATAGPK